MVSTVDMGLFGVFLLVLLCPFFIKKVEEQLEAFLFVRERWTCNLFGGCQRVDERWLDPAKPADRPPVYPVMSGSQSFGAPVPRQCPGRGRGRALQLSWSTLAASRKAGFSPPPWTAKLVPET